MRNIVSDDKITEEIKTLKTKIIENLNKEERVNSNGKSGIN